MTARPLLEARAVCKSFRLGERVVPVLRDVTLQVDRGEALAITGASGSGKSTFVQILAGLDAPTSGACLMDGIDLGALDDDARSQLRASRIGFVFQGFHLLPQLDILRNVALPFLYAGDRGAEPRRRAAEALARVGLSHRLEHRPRELSGGEMQRAAIARALVMRPEAIIADEPTGNLDSLTGSEILGLLEELNRGGTTMIIVTHDEDIARRAHRRARLSDGRLAAA